MNDKFILEESQYKILQYEYQKSLSRAHANPQVSLREIISRLQKSTYHMPENLRVSVINLLSKAQQLIDILYPNHQQTAISNSNNPFHLIHHLSKIINKLNPSPLKSPYQSLCLKANDLILLAIIKISEYFTIKQK